MPNKMAYISTSIGLMKCPDRAGLSNATKCVKTLQIKYNIVINSSQ